MGTNGVAVEGAGAIDQNGHGTHVAGIAAAGRGDGVGIAGVAPAARVVPVRVLDSTGAGTSGDVANGIRWAVDHGADVINLSLGGDQSMAVTLATDYAESMGVVVVAAAGNAGPSGPVSYPAALDSAVAVASHDASGALSSFSSNGPQVDVAAPGSGIFSSSPGSQWKAMSGTSMATPHVTGTVALMLQIHPTRSPAQVRELLRTTAIDEGPTGFDNGYGWGRLNAGQALSG